MVTDYKLKLLTNNMNNEIWYDQQSLVSFKQFNSRPLISDGPYNNYFVFICKIVRLSIILPHT